MDTNYPAPQPNPQNDREVEPSDESISGWLKFFLIFPVAIGSALSVIMTIAKFEGGDMFWGSLTDLAIATIYLITGFLTLVAFSKRDRDAVFLAKIFVVIGLLDRLVAVISGGADFAHKDLRYYIGGLIISIIWFLYLCVSKQVRRIIPPSYRKSKKRDWIIIAAAVLVPAIGVAVGSAALRSEQKAREEREAIVMAMPLKSNQRTDGRVIYTYPGWVDCEEKIENGVKMFTFNDEEKGNNVTVTSTYNPKFSKRNFEDNWEMVKNGLGDGWTYSVTWKWTEEIPSKGAIIYYRQTKLTNMQNESIYWDYGVIFHHNTGKACAVSGLSQSSTADLFRYVVENLEFK